MAFIFLFCSSMIGCIFSRMAARSRLVSLMISCRFLDDSSSTALTFGFCSSVRVSVVVIRSICCSTVGNPRFPFLGTLLVESCAVATVLQAINPPRARAATKLSFFIFNCPVFFIGLFGARRITRRRNDCSLHKEKTFAKQIGYNLSLQAFRPFLSIMECCFVPIEGLGLFADPEDLDGLDRVTLDDLVHDILAFHGVAKEDRKSTRLNSSH